MAAPYPSLLPRTLPRPRTRLPQIVHEAEQIFGVVHTNRISRVTAIPLAAALEFLQVRARTHARMRAGARSCDAPYSTVLSAVSACRSL